MISDSNVVVTEVQVQTQTKLPIIALIFKSMLALVLGYTGAGLRLHPQVESSTHGPAVHFIVIQN
jgi:hypothetical protein